MIPGSFQPVRQQQGEEEDTRPSWRYWRYISTERIRPDDELLNIFAVSTLCYQQQKQPQGFFHVTTLLMLLLSHHLFSYLSPFTWPRWRLLLSCHLFTYQTPASFPQWISASTSSEQKILLIEQIKTNQESLRDRRARYMLVAKAGILQHIVRAFSSIIPHYV